MKDSFDTVRQFYKRQIKKHKEEINLESDDAPTDYVEAFLKEKAKRQRTNENDHLYK